jgi:transposase InsO family protein
MLLRSVSLEAGLVFHSDRGGEYCGYVFRDRLERCGIVQSINRPKTMTDNAYVESFFHSLKTEAIHGRRFSDAMQLDTAVRRYIERYNRTRIHSSLAYMSPIDYERTNA